MDTLFTTLLILHIAAGSIALVTGSIASVSKKGSKIHKRGGRIYYYGMIAVAVTAFGMSIMKENQFLLAVGIFSLYMAYTGNRAVKKRKNEARYLQWIDDAMVTAGMGGGGLLIFLGLPSLLQGTVNMNIVSVIFGAITLWMALQDLKMRFSEKRYDKKANLILHISRMGGAFIATVTAFLVTNVYIEPQWILWLAPTAAGSIFMARASRKWRKKLYPERKNRTKVAQTIESQAG